MINLKYNILGYLIFINWYPLVLLKFVLLLPWWKVYWMLDVSQTASNEITLICLSVCLAIGLSIHLSITKFSQDWIISFFWYLHDSWPWYLVIGEVRFFNKTLAVWILTKWVKIWLETRFYVIFSSLVRYFSLKLHTMIAGNNV